MIKADFVKNKQHHSHITSQKCKESHNFTCPYTELPQMHYDINVYINHVNIGLNHKVCAKKGLGNISKTVVK